MSRGPLLEAADAAVAAADQRASTTQALGITAWREAQAAADQDGKRKWLERAHRLMPRDANVSLALAGTLLDHEAIGGAAALFQAVADAFSGAEAWTGVAACAHLLGQVALARDALEHALRAGVPTGTIRMLAAAIAPQGWCGLDSGGRLHGTPAAAAMDGRAIALDWSGDIARLPPDWRSARVLEVAGALGSPLPVRPFAGVEGFVEAVAGGVRGWAWHPADPGRVPTIHVAGPNGTRVLRLRLPADGIEPMRPLAQPRRLVLGTADVATLGTPLSLRGPDGRHLLGSPLDPGLERRAAADRSHAGFAPMWADIVGPPPQPGPARPVDVVIPVHGGGTTTLACIASVLASVPRGTRVIVVDDASPDPDLAGSLDRLHGRRRIVLVRLAENRGFPGAANAGLREAAGRDAVLLNSDTLVPPGWLERLRAAAYSAPDIGTATPLTNDGTIVSYPAVEGGNPAPDLPGTIGVDALAARANGAATVDVPVGVGFCCYLRRDCLDDVGLLREDLFAQGYGEENDFCLRARHRGWRNVAALGVFVAHVGAASFGVARAHLMRRNAAILARLHPGYEALIAAHAAADPLGLARRRMDALRWEAGRCRAGAVVLVTHRGGGGVDRVIEARTQAVIAAGQRPIILRPAPGGVRVEQPDGGAFPNLIFRIPAQTGMLVRLLRGDRPRHVELHHLLGHHHGIADLAARLGVEQVSVVHDYARFCPRIALVGTGQRYCGEPDVAGCEACIADLGSLLEDDPPVRVLLERSAAELAQSARVIAPSADAAARIARHFPGIDPEVEAWEDDRVPARHARVGPSAVTRVVTVGAIGLEKGFDVLLGCVRDARMRSLPLEFVVVGHTSDDARLMAAGPVFVTGFYVEEEAVTLIRAQAARLAFIPSIFPETWCFALTRAWDAGLQSVVFDLGAQAARVRTTGRGWVLPLALSPRAVNDVLLRLAPARLAPARLAPARLAPDGAPSHSAANRIDPNEIENDDVR